MSEYSCIWIERLFKKVPLPYPIVSLVAAVSIYSIFMFFSTKVKFLSWDFYHIIVALALSFLIAFQLWGIKYLLNNMEKTFNSKSYPKNEDIISDIYIKLKHRLSNSYLYYLIVGTVVVPFVILELIRISNSNITFYSVDPTVWSFLLDIYNYAIGFFMLFLLAIILWIIFNIAWTLNEIGNKHYIQMIKIDLFNPDKIGGMKSLRDLIIKILIFYFICITLAIISYITPSSILSYESFFLIVLLLIGIIFFFIGLGTIQKLLKGKIQDEIKEINERYQKHHQKLLDIASEGDFRNQGDELNWVSTTLEALHTERERMLQLYGNSKVYDITIIIEFIASFAPPLVAFLQKVFPNSTLIVLIQKLLDFGLEFKKAL